MRQTIKFQAPLIEPSEKTAYITVTKTKVDHNGVILETNNISFDKNLSHYLIIENPGERSSMIIKAGDVFPSSVLGDYKIELAPGTSVINMQDIKRFETTCEEIVIDLGENFSGEMYAITNHSEE